MAKRTSAKNEMEKKIRDLEFILELSRAMTREKDIDNLLNFIMDVATRMMDADRSSLFLVDFETGELWSRIAQDAEISEIRFPIGMGIAGSVAKTGEIVNIKDAYEDPRFNREIDKKTGYRTRTILCMPLSNHEGEIIGVIQVLNKSKGIFTDYDENILAALSSHAAVAIENAELYRERELMFESLVKTLAATIDARDPVTAGHSQRVAQYSLNMARALGLIGDDLKCIEYSAFLHDVGKIGVRDNVLLKPGRLDKEEYKKIQAHVVYTREILRPNRFPRQLRGIPELAAAHHEKVNGKGYPEGLLGDGLPIEARILAVADVFDALTAYDRPYKKAMPLEKALSIIQSETGEAFDPEVVRAFVEKKCYLIEQREFNRISPDVAIEYRVLMEEEALKEEDNYEKDAVSTMSGSGLSIKTRKFVPPGKLMEMKIILPDTTIEVMGKVVRVKRDELGMQYDMGIAFIGLPEDVKKRISEYLDMKFLEESQNPDD